MQLRTQIIEICAIADPSMELRTPTFRQEKAIKNDVMTTAYHDLVITTYLLLYIKFCNLSEVTENAKLFPSPSNIIIVCLCLCVIVPDSVAVLTRIRKHGVPLPVSVKLLSQVQDPMQVVPSSARSVVKLKFMEE